MARVISVQEKILAAPVVTAGVAYATIVTDTITLAAGDMLLVDAWLACRGNATGSQNGYLRINFNGTTWRDVGQFMPSFTPPSPLAAMALSGVETVGASGLIVGVNTINLQWRDDSATNNINITPATDGEGAGFRLIRFQP